MVHKMAKPKEMRLLLDEFIKEQSLLDNSEIVTDHPGRAIFEMMKERQVFEAHSNDGSYNPFADTCVSAVQLFIQKREAKRRCIMLHGVANSGKSTFLNIFKEIFQAYDERSTGQRFGVQLASSEHKPSLCVSDEWKAYHLKPSQIDETKRKLEGHGTIHEEKGQDPIIVFKDAFFLYANNNIHSMFTRPHVDLEEEEMNNLGAMNARMKRHHFSVSYRGT